MHKLPYSLKKVGKISDEQLETLRNELTGKDWKAHQTPAFALKHNWYIPILTSKGEMNNRHELPFKVCETGKAFPEIVKFRDTLNITPLRTRLMLIEAGGEVPGHYDDKGWDDKARLHIPLHTHESIIFKCGEESAHMAAGEMWVIDNYDFHRVKNPSQFHRVHLVIDIYLDEIKSIGAEHTEQKTSVSL